MPQKTPFYTYLLTPFEGGEEMHLLCVPETAPSVRHRLVQNDARHLPGGDGTTLEVHCV